MREGTVRCESLPSLIVGFKTMPDRNQFGHFSNHSLVIRTCIVKTSGMDRMFGEQPAMHRFFKRRGGDWDCLKGLRNAYLGQCPNQGFFSLG
jgi:hypothetical protein